VPVRAYANLFTNAIIFLLIALEISLLDKLINRLRRTSAPAPAPAAPPEDVVLLREIRDSLRRG
jgi:large conductance mechanosensitive channel